MKFYRYGWNFLQQNQHRHPKIPLKFVLTIPFVLLTLGTVGLVDYLSWRNGQLTINNLVNQLLLKESDHIHLYLSNYLETPDLINRLNAQAISSGQIRVNDPESLKRNFLQQVQQFNSIRIHFSNPQGGLIGVGNDERGFTTSSTNNFTQGTLHVRHINSLGQPSQTLVTQLNYDARQRPFYQKAVAIGKPTWSPIFAYVPAARGLGIAASYPIYNQAHKLQGVLSTDLTLAAITDSLRKFQIGNQIQVFIIERSGLMVASSTAESPTILGANQTIERLNATQSQAPLIRLTAEHLYTRFGNLDQIHTAQQLQFDLQGNRQFTRITPYRDSLGLDWLIIMVVSESSFTAAINANTQITILLSIAALIGSTSLGLWLAQSIVQPIRRLGQISSTSAKRLFNQATQQDSLISELQVLHVSLLQLQQQRDLRETVYNESTDAIFLVNPQTLLISDCNRRAVELFEAIDKSELIGIEGRTLQRHSFTAKEIDEIVAEMNQKGFWSREIEYITCKGNSFWGNLAAKPVQVAEQLIHLVRVTDITERKKAEEELQESKRFIERIANASPNLWYIYDHIENRNIYANKEIAAVLGYTVQEMQAMGPALLPSIVHPDDLANFPQHLEKWKTATDDDILEIEYRVRNAQGEWRTLVTLETVFDRTPNGTVKQVIGTSTDITDRKRIEEERKQAEEALAQEIFRRKAMLDASVDGIVVLDQQGNVIEANPSFARMIGYTPEETATLNLVDWDVYLAPEKAHQNPPLSLCSNPFETRHRRKDGSVYDVEVSANSVNWDGQIVQLCICRDITTNKKNEEALKQSEQLFRGAFETSAFGISIRSPAGNYLQVNQTLCQMLGYTEAELLQLGYKDITHPNDLAINPDNTIKKLLSGEIPYYHLEKRFIHKDGHVVWGMVSISLVRDLQQQPLYFVAQTQDITNRKKAEEALSQSEERFRSAFLNAPIGMALIRLDNCWLKVNPVLCNMLGYLETELLFMSIADLVHPEDVEKFQTCVEQVLSS